MYEQNILIQKVANGWMVRTPMLVRKTMPALGIPIQLLNPFEQESIRGMAKIMKDEMHKDPLIEELQMRN